MTEAKTIEQFCTTWNLSRSQFYKIRKQGKAPRIVKALGRPLILAADEAAWRDKLAKSAD
jgi:hypothetical protein